MKYIQKQTRAVAYERTGEFYVDEDGNKYPQYTKTEEECHVIKIRGSNIVLSSDEIEELIPFLRRVVDNEEVPLNG